MVSRPEKDGQADAPDTALPCMAVLMDLLFEGRAPNESRIEALLDHVERRRGDRAWAR